MSMMDRVNELSAARSAGTLAQAGGIGLFKKIGIGATAVTASVGAYFVSQGGSDTIGLEEVGLESTVINNNIVAGNKVTPEDVAGIIKIEDEDGNSVVIEDIVIDDSEVDYSKPGTYPVAIEFKYGENTIREEIDVVISGGFNAVVSGNFATSGKSRTYLYDAAEIDNGNIVSVGTTQANDGVLEGLEGVGYKGLVSIVRPDGTIVKNTSTQPFASATRYTNVVSGENCFYAGGYAAKNGLNTAIITKFTNSGSVVWTKSIAQNDGTSADSLTDLEIDKHGNLIVGTISIEGGVKTTHLHKLSRHDGSKTDIDLLSVIPTINTTASSNISSFEVNMEGDVFLTYVEDSVTTIYSLSFDEPHNNIVRKNHSNIVTTSGINASVTNLRIGSDKYCASGFYDDPTLQLSGLLTCYDFSGRKIIEKVFGFEETGDELFVDVTFDNNGDIVLVGQTNSDFVDKDFYGDGSKYNHTHYDNDFLVVRYDKNGKLIKVNIANNPLGVHDYSNGNPVTSNDTDKVKGCTTLSNGTVLVVGYSEADVNGHYCGFISTVGRDFKFDNES